MFLTLTTTIGRIASSSAALTFASIAASQEIVLARIPALPPAFMSGASVSEGAGAGADADAEAAAALLLLVGATFLRGGKFVLP